MPGFMPGIHVLRPCSDKDVDGRDEPGHDELRPGLVAGNHLTTVMPGFMPGIHVLAYALQTTKDVDGRNKSGHDEGLYARP